MKSFFLALFILFCSSSCIVACDNNNPIATASIQNGEDMGLILQKAFDSLKVVNPILKDFRSTSTLNPRITVTDIPGSGDEGRTIIACDGIEIFNNTWNIPSYEHDRMQTRVRHGFSNDGTTYFLWLYNISTFGAGVGSEYKIFIIQNSGPISDISSNFKSFKFGIVEMEPGKWIVKSTNGWVRAPNPGYYSILYSNGTVEEYSVKWEDFH